MHDCALMTQINFIVTVNVLQCPRGGSGPYCCENGANNPDCCQNGGRGNQIKSYIHT